MKKKTTTKAPDAIAIVGIACLFPKAGGRADFWSNCRDGVDAVGPIPSTHWDPADFFDADPKRPDFTYAKRGAFLSPVDFDPLEFGFAPKDIEATDTSQLLGMMVARDALRDAGYRAPGDTAWPKELGEGRAFDPKRTGVILGVTGALELVIPLGARLGHPLWKKAMLAAGVDPSIADDAVERISEGYVGWQENSFPGLLGNVVAGRIANKLDLGGTNCVVDAACASSLGALHLASMELATGKSELVVAGGVDTFNDIFMYMCFSKTPALSPSGDAKPFDADGDGTTLGEGVGMLVLKRLADAERDGDRIRAVIRGIGSSCDGRGTAIYEPSAEGQVRALRDAYARSGVSPTTVELVEAHGTGTKVGDAIEASALGEVYREASQEGTWCALGSLKSMIGHAKAAAGVAGVIKAALSLERKTLPPTLKVRRPNAQLQPGASPFYVNTAPRPWLPREAHPRRAAVSALGFGGSNFHCVLEEHGAAKATPDENAETTIAAFSAGSTEALLRTIAVFPKDAAWSSLRAAAAVSRAAFDAKAAQRVVVVIEKGGDAARVLESAGKLVAAKRASSPDGAYYGSGAPGKLAFLFPGQGSQSVGMLRDLACRYPEMIDTLAEADAVWTDPEGEGRLSDRVYPHPTFTAEAAEADERALRDTRRAQPAIGAVSLGAARVLKRYGVKPALAAGHSYGELTALCAAGRLSPEEFFRLSALRGKLMADGLGDKGSMLAVQAPLDEVSSYIKEGGFDLVLANKNAPAQGVLSGATGEIERAEAFLREKGVRVKRLPVSAAFHSKLVAGAREPFETALGAAPFKKSELPVYANASAGAYPDAASKARALLAGQLASPVEFVAEIEAMYAAGATDFLEVGPGARLTGLVGAILDEKPHSACALDASQGKRSGAADLARALAWAAARGHAVALDAWDPEAPKPPEGKKRFTVLISGANYRAPHTPRPPVKAKPPERLIAPMKPGTAGLPPRQAERLIAPMRPGTAGLPPRQAERLIAPMMPGTAGLPPRQEKLVVKQETNPQSVPAFAAPNQAIEALRQIQQQTAELHAKFLEGQERALFAMQALVAGQPLPAMPVTTLPVLSAPAPIVAAAAPAPAPAAFAAPRLSVSAPIPVAANGNGNHGMETSLLAIVADKTGYPAEMLNLDMGLDSDLGIDSIKRVEILSAMQEKFPNAPAVKPDQLGTIKTLGQVIAHMANGSAGAAVSANGNGSRGMEGALIAIVSEKTGYPAEMLNLDMGLDSDLGIDSIKRVEILSALQEKYPSAPTVRPDQLGTIKTLGQVIAHMSNGNGAERPIAPMKPGTEGLPPHQKASAEAAGAPLNTSRVEAVETGKKTERAVRLAGETVLIVAEGDTRADALAKAFAAEGGKAKVVPPSFDESLDGVAGVVIAAEIVDAAFLRNALLFSKRCAAARLRFFCTLTALGGRFGFENFRGDPLSGALAGLAKTAAREWDAVLCKAIDCGAFDAAAVVDECLARGPLETGLDGARRFALVERSFAPAPRAAPVSPGELVVVTGGARGVTAACAAALAAAWKPTMVLLGRSEIPAGVDPYASANDDAALKKAILAAEGVMSPKALQGRVHAVLARREIEASLKKIENSGATAVYRSLDARDASAMKALFQELRSVYGPVRGLVHGAGVLADRLIADKTAEQFDQVFGTKLDGAAALLGALDPGEAKFAVFFSSTTARFGRKGQVDYAMANEALNKLARSCGIRAVSFNWGPWRGGMVTPALEKVFEAEGVGLIDVSSGAKLLVDALADPACPSELVVLGEAPMPFAFERTVALEDHPVLNSHRLAGKPVLPAALMAEWLAHAALHANPGLGFSAIEDFRVLKGVVLDKPARLRFYAGRIRDGVCPVEMRSSDGAPRARARVLLGHAGEAPEGVALDLDRSSLSAERIYNEHLFHGEPMRFIESVDGLSDAGIVCRARTAPVPSEWMKKPLRSRWITDPAAIDAAFQALIVWSRERKGMPCLPTGFASYKQFRAGFPKGGVILRAKVIEAAARRARADVDFIDDAGAVVARMSGYDCVLDAGLDAAFKNGAAV